MKRLVWYCLPLASAACAAATTPPAQVVDPLPTVAEVPSNAPSAAPADIGASLDPGTPPPPPESFQPVSGTLGGSAFQLKGAATSGPIQKDGYVLVQLGNYVLDCGVREATPEDRTISILIPWKAHTKLDLGTLKATEAFATTFDDKKKKPAPLKGFKPKGSVEVVAAPSGMRSSGRIKLDLSSGKDSALTAEIPVKLCMSN